MNYDPWWNERDPPYSIMKQQYHEGWEDGYSHAVEIYKGTPETIDKLKNRIEQLEGLLAANVRVIKAELKKELDGEDKETIDREGR